MMAWRVKLEWDGMRLTVGRIELHMGLQMLLLNSTSECVFGKNPKWNVVTRDNYLKYYNY